MNSRLKFKSYGSGFTRTLTLMLRSFCVKLVLPFHTRKKTSKLVCGFTLVEMVIYIAILSIIVVLVTSSILVMSKSLSSIQTSRKINNFAETSLERIVREIRFADSVDTLNSTFGVSPGVLKLNTIDPTSEIQGTVEFYLSGLDLMIKEGNNPPEDITPSSLSITDLIFYNIVIPDVSESIKVEVEVTGSGIYGDKTEKFYSTIVLKRSY